MKKKLKKKKKETEADMSSALLECSPSGEDRDQGSGGGIRWKRPEQGAHGVGLLSRQEEGKGPGGSCRGWREDKRPRLGEQRAWWVRVGTIRVRVPGMWN